ncbi:MAG: M20/M25/M40 family metallo-hydrolase [Clostridiales bacterium]|nr:M20/M25/M40 family metallo-hydrolase [Clostridiales bacterium]
MTYFWLALAALVVAFLAVILIRTLRFRPKAAAPATASEAVVDEQKAIDDLAAMIRCKTVSYYEDERIDKAEFAKFRALLKTLYPTVFERCTYEEIGPSGVLFSLKGKSAEKPAVFMSHYDVVPVNEEQWSKPAFDGIVEDGVLWGRGTLDTKGTLLGTMEAAEQLLKGGFVPENDMYFAFAGDEEVAGKSQPIIVETLRARGVTPAIVVDEGGAVVEGIFPGVSEPCALVGIAEKGLMDAQFVIEGAGGHASAPPPHTGIGRLSRAVTRIEGKPFPRVLTKPVAEMFDTLGRRSSFVYRMIFANLWCFLPVLDGICKKSGGELNAMMRTTCAFTMAEGSKASNVLPPRARMVANLRVISGSTCEETLSALKGRLDDDGIQASIIHGTDPSKISETTGYGWEKLTAAIAETWPDTLISPYLMFAASDSRHYCAISDDVYRFSAMALSKEDRAGIHGNDERIATDKIVKTVQFYLRLMRSL